MEGLKVDVRVKVERYNLTIARFSSRSKYLYVYHQAFHTVEEKWIEGGMVFGTR